MRKQSDRTAGSGRVRDADTPGGRRGRDGAADRIIIARLTAEDMLREASALLGSITVNYWDRFTRMAARATPHGLSHTRLPRVGRDQLLISKPN